MEKGVVLSEQVPCDGGTGATGMDILNFFRGLSPYKMKKFVTKLKALKSIEDESGVSSWYRTAEVADVLKGILDGSVTGVFDWPQNPWSSYKYVINLDSGLIQFIHTCDEEVPKTFKIRDLMREGSKK